MNTRVFESWIWREENFPVNFADHMISSHFGNTGSTSNATCFAVNHRYTVAKMGTKCKFTCLQYIFYQLLIFFINFTHLIIKIFLCICLSTKLTVWFTVLTCIFCPSIKRLKSQEMCYKILDKQFIFHISYCLCTLPHVLGIWSPFCVNLIFFNEISSYNFSLFPLFWYLL